MVHSCLRLLQSPVILAFQIAFEIAGSRSAARIPMITMTTSSSTSVKPLLDIRSLHSKTEGGRRGKACAVGVRARREAVIAGAYEVLVEQYDGSLRCRDRASDAPRRLRRLRPVRPRACQRPGAPGERPRGPVESSLVELGSGGRPHGVGLAVVHRVAGLADDDAAFAGSRGAVVGDVVGADRIAVVEGVDVGGRAAILAGGRAADGGRQRAVVDVAEARVDERRAREGQLDPEL